MQALLLDGPGNRTRRGGRFAGAGRITGKDSYRRKTPRGYLNFNTFKPNAEISKVEIASRRVIDADLGLSSTTVVVNDNLSLLWDTTLRRELWRGDYRVGSVNCCGPMIA